MGNSYYENNKEKRKDYQRAYRKRNLEKIKEANKKYQKGMRKYTDDTREEEVGIPPRDQTQLYFTFKELQQSVMGQTGKILQKILRGQTTLIFEHEKGETDKYPILRNQQPMNVDRII